MTLLMFFTDWILSPEAIVKVPQVAMNTHQESIRNSGIKMNIDYYYLEKCTVTAAVSGNDDKEIRHGYFPPTHNDSLVKDFAFVHISPW